ncbi:hypothetical protein BS78_10G214800 [Paspalum vaginatum]|nr:hypothetical protein BS78_10G214800 [Paspalum vaginatum]
MMAQQQTMQAEGSGSLPEDIVFDVLSRQPAKDLCRFRCVSTVWRELISDSAFVSAQKSRAGPGPLLIGVFRGPRILVPSNKRKRYAGGGACHRHMLELRVTDMDGNVLRVVKDIKDSEPELPLLQLVRLDILCLDDRQLAVDPATWRAVLVGRYVNDPTAGELGIRYSSYGRAAPSGVYKAVRLCETFRDVAILKGKDVARLRETLCEVAMLEDGCAEDDLAWREISAPPPFGLCG